MDTKMAQHMQMVIQYGLYKLTKEQASSVLHEVTLYEDSHGFGFTEWEDTDAYEKAYTEFTKNDDGFKKLWHEWNVLFDESQKYLKEFAKAMVDFTDGQIDEFTARQMAISQRTEKELEEVLLGKE